MTKIPLGEKIGSGVHRETFEVKGQPRKIAKVLRDWFVLRIGTALKIHIPGIALKVLSFIRYGTLNVNEYERDILASLPKSVMRYVACCPEIAETTDGRTALINTRLKNFDGTFAQTLHSHGPVNNPAFWQHWNHLFLICKKENIALYDVFRNPKNILVHKISETEWVPMIIDVKSLNATNTYLDILPIISKTIMWARIDAHEKKTRRRYDVKQIK